MHEHGLIFSRSGDRKKLYRVNPLLFSQFGLNNHYALPTERDLPQHGLILRQYNFDFGFADQNTSIAPYDTAFCPLVMGRDFLVEMVTATYQAAAAANPPSAGQPGANGTPGFLVNWLHTHNGVQRQFANKNLTDIEACGDGFFPTLLKSPALLPQGDTITCVIQNLANVTLQAQILFTGAEFDTETFGQEAGA